jgi:hypothetical protein
MSDLTPRSPQDWADFRRAAQSVGSNGCTGVPDFYGSCCDVHDYAYRTGRSWRDGAPVTRAQADAAFRDCIQSRSALGRLSPIAWVRWGAVRLLGRLLRYGPN